MRTLRNWAAAGIFLAAAYWLNAPLQANGDSCSNEQYVCEVMRLGHFWVPPGECGGGWCVFCCSWEEPPGDDCGQCWY